jgi:hypothetical protein
MQKFSEIGPWTRWQEIFDNWTVKTIEVREERERERRKRERGEREREREKGKQEGERKLWIKVKMRGGGERGIKR